MKTIIVILALASSFMPGKKTESKANFKHSSTVYNWFNTSGTYLRQNTLEDEALLTGYNNIAATPYTLRELGYTQGECTGNPPVPIDPDFPEQRLYSHP